MEEDRYSIAVSEPNPANRFCTVGERVSSGSTVSRRPSTIGYVSSAALRKKGATTLLIIGFGSNPPQTCSRPTALSANRRSDTSAASPASPDVPSDLPASPTRPSPAADRAPAATARDLNPPRYPVKRLYFPRRIRPSLD